LRAYSTLLGRHISIDPSLQKQDTVNLLFNIQQFIIRFKLLQGNPHYIAMGMSIGIFIGITPTIPFHTVLAVALAYIFRASKAAAAIGVWFSNPLTIPFFYVGSYKAGMFLLGCPSPFDRTARSVSELLELGLDVTCATITGGLIIGIPPAIAGYFITRKIVKKIRSRKGHNDNPQNTS
jgi:uncharacterized protein (DUF2062 family)